MPDLNVPLGQGSACMACTATADEHVRQRILAFNSDVCPYATCCIAVITPLPAQPQLQQHPATVLDHVCWDWYACCMLQAFWTVQQSPFSVHLQAYLEEKAWRCHAGRDALSTLMFSCQAAWAGHTRLLIFAAAKCPLPAWSCRAICPVPTPRFGDAGSSLHCQCGYSGHCVAAQSSTACSVNQ